jgi:phage terminase small subunit
VRKLSQKQEDFAKAIALDGMKQIDAYKASYSAKNMSDDAIYVEASRLAADPRIALRIKELSKEADSPRVMNAKKRREKLTELANSDDPNVAMKAIDLLNKMDGEYVQKIAADVQTETTINIELVEEE